MKRQGIVFVVFFAIAALLVTAGSAAAKQRFYFIQAEDMEWDYAPSGSNLIHCLDQPYPCDIPDPWTNSHVFQKVRYVEYTDATFTTRVPPPGATEELPWGWLGVLGPIIRAEVGDKVIVHFKNATSMIRPDSGPLNLGMHPHGLRYTKDNEGAFYNGVNSGQDPGAGTQIPPGGEFIYHWVADADSSPGLADANSQVWWYHSHVDEPYETNLGLLGPIIIVRRGFAKEVEHENTNRKVPVPRDVDKEFVACFFIFDELGGEEPGLMHAINGYFFGNLKGLVMNRGDRVRWYLLGMGNEVDLHTAHWHGKVVTLGNPVHGQKTDVVELLPASMKTATMKANNPGEWIFHCHVADHIHAGMMTTFQILP